MKEPDINKAIKERFQGGWRASQLSLLRNSSNTDVKEIIQEADGLAAEDENSGCELKLLSFTVTSFVIFILTYCRVPCLTPSTLCLFVCLFNTCQGVCFLQKAVGIMLNPFTVFKCGLWQYTYYNLY